MKVGEHVPGRPRQASEGGKVHKETFNVVGILAPTGTPIDRAIFVNMEGFYDIHDAEQAPADGRPAAKHADEEAGTATSTITAAEEHADEHAHDAHKQVTALLVCVAENRPGMADLVAKRINTGAVAVKKRVEVKTGDKVEHAVQLVNEAQAVVPARVIADLFEGVVGKIQWILLGMAVLTVIVAGIGIMVSIYNSMSDRRHEIAIMRALGAQPRHRDGHHPGWSRSCCRLGGGVLGLLLGHGLIGLCSPADRRMDAACRSACCSSSRWS